MGLFSWPFGSKRHQEVIPDDAAASLVEVLVEWCSPESLDANRQSLSIPECAKGFEREMFYLYVFLTSVSIELSYAKRMKYGLSLGQAFMERIGNAIEEGRFRNLNISPEILDKRYRQYLALRSRGLEYMIENLPYAVLVTNEVCPSDKREHMALVARPLMTLQVWVGVMLKQLCEVNDKWQSRFLL